MVVVHYRCHLRLLVTETREVVRLGCVAHGTIWRVSAMWRNGWCRILTSTKPQFAALPCISCSFYRSNNRLTNNELS